MQLSINRGWRDVVKQRAAWVIAGIALTATVTGAVVWDQQFSVTPAEASARANQKAQREGLERLFDGIDANKDNKLDRVEIDLAGINMNASTRTPDNADEYERFKGLSGDQRFMILFDSNEDGIIERSEMMNAPMEKKSG